VIARLLPCAVLLLAACGGGDDDGGEASAADAATAVDASASDNHLGETCSDGDPCPGDHQCIFLSVGNPDLGYCSPICADDGDCGDGYTGPATGTLTCFVPDHPDACTIGCDDTADCPGDLTCVETGGPFSVCTTR
jgi:hypothetical protein